MNLLTNRKALYCLWLLFLLVFLGIVGYKYRMEARAINGHHLVSVKLIETTCNEIGGSRSSASFSINGIIHLINLTGHDCNNYKPGSMVWVLYDAEDDIYFPAKRNNYFSTTCNFNYCGRLLFS